MRYDPNMNSIKVNPLIITKPTFKDADIEDVYYNQIDEDNYDVIVVKRFAPDYVRSSSYPMGSKINAIEFMRSLYAIDDVQSHLRAYEKNNDEDIRVKEVIADISENSKSVQKTFSFGDEDYINPYQKKSCTKISSNKNEKSVRIDSSIF